MAPHTGSPSLFETHQQPSQYDVNRRKNGMGTSGEPWTAWVFLGVQLL